MIFQCFRLWKTITKCLGKIKKSDTALPLPMKLYVALRVGVAVILSQRPTSGTLEYSTNRFCGENYVLAGVLKSQVFKLCFGAKSFVLGKKLAKLKKRRTVKPTCSNGGTNRANGGTNASFCTSGNFPFFLAWRCCQICFEFESATVKSEKKKKKERKKKKKDCGQLQRQREKIYLIFRRASSLEKQIDDCLHLVRRISHAVDIAVHV